jgi:phospholipase/lecithinase/hemolysin
MTAFGSTALALPFSYFFVFGDSLSDTGNAALAVDAGAGLPTIPPGSRAPVPIPDPLYVPDRPYRSDRLSNGPVWAEQLATDLGLGALPSLAGGTSFAFGGSRMEPDVKNQVSSLITASGGVVPDGGLYAVWGGSNDARDAIDAVVGAGGDPAAAAPFISAYESALDASVAALANAGAKTILVPNLGNIGLTPAILFAETIAPGSAAQARMLTMAFNDAWSMTLSDLAASLGPTVDLIELDVFGLLNDVALNPGLYGLTNSTDACAFDLVCIAAPEGHLFWDGVHPTAAGHAIIADFALRAVVPGPGTPALLAGGLVLVRFVRRGGRGPGERG